MSCLVVTSGRAKGRTFKITPERQAVVGRVSECDVCIADPHVSRRHCLISAGQTGYVIKDLGSANGTTLNGVRITEAPLKDGDKLAFGKVAVEFHQEERFEDAETKKLAPPAGPASPPAPAQQAPAQRKRSARADTQALLEFCARCSGSIPPGEIVAGKAKRLAEGPVCAECLASEAAGTDAASVSKLAADLTASPALPAAQIPPSPPSEQIIELDGQGLPVVPAEPPPPPAPRPEVKLEDVTTPIPGKLGKAGR